MRVVVLASSVGCVTPRPPAAPAAPIHAAAIVAAARVEPPPAAPAIARPIDRVAEDAARSASVGYVVAAPTVRAAMARELGSGLAPYVLTGWGTRAEIDVQLGRGLAELRATTPLDQLARAYASGPAGQVGVAIALPPPSLPIAIEREAARVRLVLAWPWAAPAVAFAVTETRAIRVPARLATDRVEVELECGARTERTIELRAGERVIAEIVDACGDAARPADEAADDDLGPPARTRAEIEQRVFALVNRERVRHGRAPLAWDADAFAFAREHAEDMARFEYVAHRAPGGATYHERVALARFPNTVTRENVGRAAGPGEVHLAFLRSPGHRENLLADDVDRGAIGVAVDPRDATRFYITEFFRTP